MQTVITRKSKWVALLCAAVIVLSMFLSVFYIALEADHDCTGVGCPICAAIERCENAARLFGSGTPENSGALTSFFHFTIYTLIICSPLLISSTPVTQRVRMDD